MLTQNSNGVVEGSPPLPPHHQLQQQKDLHDLSEKLLLKTISSGFPMFSAGEFYSSAAQNCSIPGQNNLPSRGSFSQIYPSINISNLNQAASAPSNSFDMNLEALDLLSSARFSRSSSFNSHPSNSHDHFDNLGIYKDSPYNNFGLHHYHQHMQQSNQRPAYNTSPSKISTTSFPSSNEITEAKRGSISPAEPKAAAAAGAAKKSRLDSRASCPPFKVRKEKLGDRIAALQQLVAPFGKTLSVPYMKSSRNKTCRPKQGGSTMEDGKEEARRDLRSRGLCLVPLSCMSYVTNDSGGGIWPPPNFTGGT
ncbi:transcription factor-like protein [Corchorus olitorius]|uniref:Transcription factor-like protein n=1 Tax=Corchorus olitorius TaxID=93759 RepID=A0A1R3HXX7_9ROSI|nr:transcription factor-like protein [Corchorus olitorius]